MAIVDFSGIFSGGSGGGSGAENAVLFTQQTLTDEQKTQARTNIGSTGYSDVHPAIVTAQPAGGFVSNIFYSLGTITGTVTFALATPSDSNIVNHYYWTFETSSTAPTITWPNGITWLGGSAPVISASKHYEISVLNGIGTFMEV